MNIIRAGMEVVCVRANWNGPHHLQASTIFPEKGSVYTIREIFEGPFQYAGAFYVRLVEIRNKAEPSELGPFEPAFNADGFRPVVKTDISAFTAMLAPTPKQKEPEHV